MWFFSVKIKKMCGKQLPLVTVPIQPWLLSRIFEALVILSRSDIKPYLTEKSVNFLVTIEVQENWHNFHSIITSNQDGIGTQNFMQHNYAFEYYLIFKPNCQKLQKSQMFLKRDSRKTHNRDPCFKTATQKCFMRP